MAVDRQSQIPMAAWGHVVSFLDRQPEEEISARHPRVDQVCAAE